VTADARPRVAVIDYGMGNRRSVEKALTHVGAETLVTADRDELLNADALVLPGVGAYPKGMANLQNRGLDTLLREQAAAGVPLLGICLGMQLLFESSREMGFCKGLGLISGSVRALSGDGVRVPHIGWNDVRFVRGSALTSGLPDGGAPFYHVHSYIAEPAQARDIVGVCEYGEPFTTIVARGNVYGSQFHPEKSSRDGLALLRSFVTIAARNGAERR
jgi:imidazole glycerol-phosphate synthase subunit HisH